MSKSKSKGAKKAAKKKESKKAVKAKVESSPSSAAAHAAPHVYDTPVDVEPVPKKLRPDAPISSVLQVRRGFVLADFDPASTPGFDEGRKEGEEALGAYSAEIGEWQERLWAETKGGGQRSLLIVLQGLDSAGKGGIVRHVMSNCDPAGIKATAFKAPTEEERAHDFLWRIRKALPGPGQIGVFDRSHYEDVLITKVRKLIPAAEVTKRYAIINAFEREVIESGTQIVKVFMYISRDERAFWDDYMKAFQTMLTRTSTVAAPWYVIPANNKWYARYAVQQLLLEKLREMSPDWPVPDYDIEAEKARLAQS